MLLRENRWRLLMKKTAEAVCHGAVTVVNAMATGKGAALGINLWTKARVTVTDRTSSFIGRNVTDPKEDTRLMQITAQHVLRKFQAHRNFGAIVETRSNIPVAVGLKSSSAASNAVALATLRALGRKMSDYATVNLAVDASLKAGVTLTGAYDDALACYVGGLAVTDNYHRRILKRYKPRGRARVLIYVPEGKKYTKDVDREQLRNIAPSIGVAHREALKGNYWLSLTLNGLAYSKALGYDAQPAKQALATGAIAAGLSGKGPAVAAIVPSSKVENVLSVWTSLPGSVVVTSFNYRKAEARSLTS